MTRYKGIPYTYLYLKFMRAELTLSEYRHMIFMRQTINAFAIASMKRKLNKVKAK